MTSPYEYNEQISAEFRAHGGKVGGRFEGRPMILVTATGAKSGEQRTTPLVYLPDGDRYLIFASKGGSPSHPAWYHNLKANPVATVEVGTEKFEAVATELTGAERDEVYAKQAGLVPAFADYQEKTTRTIPVIALTRKQA